MRKLVLDELNRLRPDDFKSLDKIALCVVLDNVRSALNVGSFFRTCDAFAVEQLHLCGITACPPNREIMKTAIGSTESVSWSHHEDIVSCIRELKEAGYIILGVEQTDASVSVSDFIPLNTAKYALVFGNEVHGLSDEILPLLDKCLEIPQYGTKHSLNVAVCGGIAIWEISEKIRSTELPD
jgi:23S rRNA (guanosine2251-2'-O)-methyltransferase